MKLLKADLLTQVVGSYDQTKTTIQGRVASKTVAGLPVLGAPLTKFVDFFTDTGGLLPTSAMYPSVNGRVFIVGTVSAGVIPIILYDFDSTTGATSYVGRINMTSPNLAATVQTVKDIRAVDTGLTGWKIYVTTTASVLINGGSFCVNNIDKADFVQVSFPTIPFATGNNQKAVYFSQNPAAIGVTQVEVLAAAMIYDPTAGRIYTHNGSAATHQYYVRDVTASMTYVTTAVTVSVGVPGVVAHAGHSFIANDPVTFTAGTLPTGLTVGATYFVRNPVAGSSYELSLTSGGASITTTGSPSSGAFIGRAFGTTSSDFLFKTGNLPALVGTLLSNGSEKKAIPVAAPINGGILNGNGCAFFASTTNLYLGLLSELTSGTTIWPSLTTSNVLGTVNQFVVPTPAFATWSNALDNCVFVTNTTKLMVKQVVNNLLTTDFGEINNNYLETFVMDTVQTGLASIASIAIEDGWLFVAGTSIGQRGIVIMDMKSDNSVNYSYIVTKVLNTPNSQIYDLTTLESLYKATGNIVVQYRTSGFGSISGGWVTLPVGSDLSAITTTAQIQFKILFAMQSEGSSSPAQINELLLGYIDNVEISDNWEYSHDNSATGVPTRCAFRLKKTYQTSVPTLYFRSYDLSDNLLINHNSVTNSAQFEYSTNNGVSWSPLGTVPNTAGTLIRYNFSSPPGVDIRPVIRES